MADWYASSVAWLAIPQFAVSGVYTVGQFVRPLTTPALGAEYAFRCTTAGTAGTEPTWPGADGGSVTTGGATFQNVSGRSAYGWSAAAGTLYLFTLFSPGGVRVAVGDRAFLSSDHTETGAFPQAYRWNGSLYGVARVISVNRAGSVPPVAADILPGASIVYNGAGTLQIDSNQGNYWQGVRFTLGGTGSQFTMGTSSGAVYLKDCAIVFTTSNVNANISNGGPGPLITLDNTTIQFNNASQRWGGPTYQCEIRWINTPAATLGTVPTTLFAGASNAGHLATCRGVDLSAITTTLYAGNTQSPSKFLFDSCRIAPGVVRWGGNASPANTTDEIELVNCYDGTNFISERHTPAGDLTTELTITLTGGATDNVGTFSHKMVSSTRADKNGLSLEGFWLDVNNTAIGTSKTATVEIVSSASLNNDEIVLLLEYEGTTGSALASFVSSFPNPLATPAAVPTSTVAWNSLPATPVKQKLQVTFTPRVAGRVRAQVWLGKTSATVYVDPRVTIT